MTGEDDIKKRLKKLKELLEEGYIDIDGYKEREKEILKCI
jgi:hypothetical protein